jgi:exopolysaccharide biosynthesis protein
MVIVGVPDTVVFCYHPRNDAPLDSIARRERLRCVINGSFFNGVRGNAGHAGWLSLYGKQVTPLMDDRQLTHVVRINGAKHATTCLPARSFSPSTDPGDVEFQTGPLVVDNGRIREDLIRSSINGSSAHTRTLLATLDHRRCFFITVSERVTLSDLAATLVRLGIFKKGRLDVVNLDGGSSVALYVRDVPYANVNVDDRLPILIGFH